MRVWTVTSQKGGSGKTTLAVNLAVAAAAGGEVVVVVDADPQASASEWKRQREAQDPLVTPASAANLTNVISLCRDNGASLVIIDTPPHTPSAESEVRRAIEVADFCIIPTRAALFDIKANASTTFLVRALGKPAALVLNATPTQGRIGEAAKVALAGYQVPLCPVTVSHRAAFANSVLHGLGAAEFEPNGKAADEVSRVWTWLWGQVA